MTPNDCTRFKRRHFVSEYVRHKMATIDKAEWERNLAKYQDIDLSCKYYSNVQKVATPSEEEIREELQLLGKLNKEDELNCGACGYETCRAHAIAIINGFAESKMCLPYTIEKLENVVSELEKSYDELKSVKEALNHKEKLASMGQLAAGIAHELNNPLGIVLMYSHMLLEQCEQGDETQEDYKMIVDQANRCKKIVSGLLNFARQNKVIKEPVNIVDLVNHCFTALSLPPEVELEITNELDNETVDVDRDQISQVLINLINNAIDAMKEKVEKNELDKGKLEVNFSGDENMIHLIIKDNGGGIPKKYLERIFDPFFTTKQIGMGTGLGLAVTYGIIKMHSGQITFDSNADANKGPTGTKVKIDLPRK